MNINNNTRKLTFLGVMLAVTIILDATPLGAIPLGGVSATIIHIPTIITGIILGPLMGLVMGTLMGIIMWVHAITRPTQLLDPLFMNPLLSVLPRVLIGVVAYYAFTASQSLFGKLNLKGIKRLPVSTVVGAIAGSFTNTVLVLSMLYILYAKNVLVKLIDAGAFGENATLGDLRIFIWGIVGTNGLPEAIVSAILVTAIVVAYKKVFTEGFD